MVAPDGRVIETRQPLICEEPAVTRVVTTKPPCLWLTDAEAVQPPGGGGGLGFGGGGGLGFGGGGGLGFGGGGGGGFGGGGGVPLFTVALNELTPRPTPPIHGSKPPWMLVRYQDRVIAPRAMMSLMKSRVLKLQLLIGDGATYEITLFWP